MFLGIDIGSQNPGYVILNGASHIEFSRTWETPFEFHASDVKRAEFQISVIKKILAASNIDVIAIEAPAFSFKNQMVSIGFIHGAVTSFVQSTGIPWIYVPPTKHKYAFLKNGRAKKVEGVRFVNSNFSFSSRVPKDHFDHNQADAAMLAHLAYLFFSFLEGEEPHFLADTEARMREIFFSEASTGKKPAGIFLRKDEFYFNTEIVWQ